MKNLLLTTIAAVVVVGGATTQSPTSPLFDAVKKGDIEAVKQHLDAGADVNARIRFKPGALSHLKGNASLDRSILGYKVTPRDLAISRESPQQAYGIAELSKARRRLLGQGIKIEHPEIAELLRKQGGKTSYELDWEKLGNPLFNAIEKCGGKGGFYPQMIFPSARIEKHQFLGVSIP